MSCTPPSAVRQGPKPRTGMGFPWASFAVGHLGNLYMPRMNCWRQRSVSVSSHISSMFLQGSGVLVDASASGSVAAAWDARCLAKISGIQGYGGWWQKCACAARGCLVCMRTLLPDSGRP